MKAGRLVAVRVLVLVLPLLGLAGCATGPGGAGGVGGMGGGSDIRTVSDQSDAEKRARVRLELASAYFARGQSNTALDEVKQALGAKPDLAEAFNLRGLIYASMNELPLAEQSFQRALQLAPRNGDTLHNHGWFLCQQRRFADAQGQFDAALAAPQYTESARTWMAQGVCQARAGNWGQAEASLARSFQLDPANPATAFSLAEVLYQRGDYDRARFYVRRVNGQADQSNAQSLWLAIRIERRMGNMPGVQDFARQLRERFPDSAEVKRLQLGQFDD